MRYLILSDIHANRAALDAVMTASSGLYDQILNCGDIVGYGPDPNYAVDFSRDYCIHTVRGNHDKAAVGLVDLEWFNPVARTSAQWTGGILSLENSAWVAGLPHGPFLLEAAGLSLVHGSPTDEDEYMTSPWEARQNAPYSPTALTFFGHSHIQGGFQVARNGGVRNLDGMEHAVVDGNSTWLVNPGSVGQPRDGDPRAAWVVYDSDTRALDWYRTEYDVEDTYRRILRAGLPEVLGLRLFRGQ